MLAPFNRVMYVCKLVRILRGHDKAFCSNESKRVNKT